jgi:hypothetical protein
VLTAWSGNRLSLVDVSENFYSDTMSGDIAEFRQRLIHDYQGAIVRLGTLQADGKHYLLFA